MNLLKTFFATLFAFFIQSFLLAQVAPILNYSVDSIGLVQLEVASSTDNYYLLQVRDEASGNFTRTASMTLGKDGTTIISEALAAHPEEHYQVLEFAIADSLDFDEDGFDDFTEFSTMPKWSPLNFARQFEFKDGTAAVDTKTTFENLSIDGQDIPWATFLNNKEFTKFIILNLETDNPEIYFINSNTHFIHQEFADFLGVGVYDSNVLTGEFIYHPDLKAPSGEKGIYSFNFSFGDAKSFETVRDCHELMAANMPFLKNNLTYYITANSQFDYDINKSFYDASRIPITFENDVFADVDYLALNKTEGFGLLRLMTLDETPGSRDVVIYEALPNTLPRVGGIITSFIQTPLSHVNLRAIQDNVPNAFIRDPLSNPIISDLIGKYVYYKTGTDDYEIREATLEEVNDWYEDLRPQTGQTPNLNLSYKDILPLDDIGFEMSDGFGAKCANVATMRTFGFPDGIIPDGFGVPFYFYQEFMKFNGFFDDARAMIADADFQSDLETRIDMLKDFRKKIKAAEMPQWMLDALQEMHESFPVGTAVRCRSSTNNEDLPGFSGAGLYTSKTQHLDEGHISKSIKQVYASMWNFRAYDERDFYRIDHFIASMGVLCHPNYSDELANGVGVSIDPIYQTDNTFYFNTQLGEDLVTNPNALSIPEEILMNDEFFSDYDVVRFSNLTVGNTLVMDRFVLHDLGSYLRVIHDLFAELYNAVGADGFAMDIEYKLTQDWQLAIKQARPWAAYWSDLSSTESEPKIQSSRVFYFPNPVDDFLNIQCECSGEMNLTISNLLGQKMTTQPINFNVSKAVVSTSSLPKGVYIMTGQTADGNIHFSKKFIKGK